MPGRGHRRRQRFARWIGRSRLWAAGADRVIELAGNVGFGRACNRGATEASGELLLVLNPDTEVRPGAVDRGAAFLRDHPGVGVVGGRAFHEDGTINRFCCFRRPSLLSAVCIAVGTGVGLPSEFGVRSLGDGGMGPRWRSHRGLRLALVPPHPAPAVRGPRGVRRAVLHVQRDADLCLLLSSSGWPRRTWRPSSSCTRAASRTTCDRRRS